MRRGAVTAVVRLRASAIGAQERRKERTRSAILDAAQELLLAEGPGVSILASTRRADVAQGSFYDYFRDKQDVFRAVADRAMETLERETLARTASIADPLERLAAGIRLYGRVAETHPRLAPVILEQGELTLQTRAEHVALFARTLAGLGVTGLLQPDETPLRISFFISSLRLVMRLRLTDPGFDDAETDRAAKMLLVLLGASPEDARRACAAPLPPPIPAA